MKAHTYPVLDGMRGVAAICVLIYHSCLWFPGVPWAASGYLAVDFFFALSGFVLAHSYDVRLRDGLGISGFMRLRLLRLYPVFLLVCFVKLALFLWALPLAQVAPTLWNILFLPVPPGLLQGSAMFPLDGPAWSLFFELGANILFAGFVWRVTTRHLACFLLFAAMVLLFCGLRHGSLDSGNDWSLFFIGEARVLYGFFAGVLVYRVRHLLKWGLPNAWIVLAVLGGLLWWAPSHGTYRAAYDCAIAIIGSPLLVAVAYSIETSGLAASIFTALGNASYPIYLVQNLILTVVGYGIAQAHLSPYSLRIAAILLALAAGVAMYRLYDDPVRRWLGKRLGANRNDRRLSVSVG